MYGQLLVPSDILIYQILSAMHFAMDKGGILGMREVNHLACVRGAGFFTSRSVGSGVDSGVASTTPSFSHR